MAEESRESLGSASRHAHSFFLSFSLFFFKKKTLPLDCSPGLQLFLFILLLLFASFLPRLLVGRVAGVWLENNERFRLALVASFFYSISFFLSFFLFFFLFSFGPSGVPCTNTPATETRWNPKKEKHKTKRRWKNCSYTRNVGAKKKIQKRKTAPSPPVRNKNEEKIK